MFHKEIWYSFSSCWGSVWRNLFTKKLTLEFRLTVDEFSKISWTAAMLPSCGDSGDGEGNGNGKEDWQNKTSCGWINGKLMRCCPGSIFQETCWLHAMHWLDLTVKGPHPGRQRKALTMGAFDTASALREDTTPTEKVSCLISSNNLFVFEKSESVWVLCGKVRLSNLRSSMASSLAGTGIIADSTFTGSWIHWHCTCPNSSLKEKRMWNTQVGANLKLYLLWLLVLWWSMAFCLASR